jgi:hypothetical protein
MNEKYPEKYPEKNPNYSPSISYNYSPQTGYNGNTQMHSRRRNNNDRFRREPTNSNERVIRQNDIIIRLLKEIRDRLPEPHFAPQTEGDCPEPQCEMQPPSESWDKDENARESDEKVNESPDQEAKPPRMSCPDEETL